MCYRKTICLLLLIALPGLHVACTDERHEVLAEELPVGPRIRAVTLDARRTPPPGTLERLRALGVTHVTLIPFGFQPRHDAAEIRFNPGARWYSESDAGIRALARAAASLGLRVVLKPHLWLGDYRTAGQTRHAIHFPSEALWQQWEAQYRAFILHYARLSEEIGAPLFCIGTELAGPARTRPDFWRALIDEVRTVYSGRLTYAANWHDEYEHLAFWDRLDYIGVQAYFPLSRREDPSLGVLKRGWAPHREALRRLHQRVGRPVLFTEVGYRSIHDAAAEPWRWPAREELQVIEPDYALQARLYQAFFESLWPEPWFAGAVIWKWYPDGERQDERRALDFTPQQKPAEDVIARWFRR